MRALLRIVRQRGSTMQVVVTSVVGPAQPVGSVVLDSTARAVRDWNLEPVSLAVLARICMRELCLREIFSCHSQLSMHLLLHCWQEPQFVPLAQQEHIC